MDRMRAAILSIGDELVLGQNLDTNSQWLADRLLERSIEAAEHRTIADDRTAIAASIRQLALRADLLIITGGLGPTADDLTRHALGDVLTPGEALERDPAATVHLEAIYARRPTPMPPSNRVQTMRPRGTAFLPNPHGTAMGIAGALGGCRVYCLPGPPREMQPMFRDHVAPRLELRGEATVLRAAAVHQVGMGESHAAELLGEMMARTSDPLVGTTVKDAIVTARVRASGPAERAERSVAETVAEIERRWQPYAFGRDEVTLPNAVGQLLRERGLTLATAESCTGGLLGSLIVSAAGSSDYYRGGWIAYDSAMKTSQLGVPARLLDQHGAVSEAVARAMAEGARQAAGTSLAAAITGIAGPGGATGAKPVGLVFIAVSTSAGDTSATSVRRFEFRGDREQVRDRSAQCALQMIRFALLGVADDIALLWETPHATRTEGAARR